MLNKLTIKKQSDLNDLIKITNKFILNGGDVFYINYKETSCQSESSNSNYNNCSYFIKGKCKDILVIFYIENDDEIVMETDLDIKTAYELYSLIVNY